MSGAVSPSRPRPPGRCAAPLTLVGCALLAAATPAWGARWFAEAGVSTSATYTTNANYQISGAREDDVILEVAPTFSIRGEGRGFRLGGSATLSSATYLGGTRSSELAPVANLSGSVEAIERWFYIDAGLAATQSAENPLAPRPDGPATFNRLSTTQARLSPYIDRALPGDRRLLIRSDSTWTHTGGATTAADGYSALHQLRFEQQPRPFGWALEGSRSETRFNEGTTPTPDVDIGRLRLRYALGGQWVVGLRAGFERSQLLSQAADNDSFGGAELAWQPSPRTKFDGYWEGRSIGSAWHASFNHRMPRLSWSINSERDLSSAAQPLLTAPTGNLAALIDAAFTTRIADPIERARAVADFLATRGLPATLSGPTTLFSDRILIRKSHSATVTWLGQRTTVAVNAFAQRDDTPVGPEFVAFPGAIATAISQRGAQLTLSHQLSTVSGLTAVAGATRTRDLSTAVVVESRQVNYRLQVDHRLAPRSAVFGGVRHHRFRSDVIDSSTETGIFAGLSHRF